MLAILIAGMLGQADSQVSHGFVIKPAAQLTFVVQKKPEPGTYMDVATRAHREGKPLVVFLNCTTKTVPGATVYQRFGTFDGRQLAGVYVCRPLGDWFDLLAVLPASASVGEITAILSPRSSGSEVRQAPRPFYRLRLLYGDEESNDLLGTADVDPRGPVGPWPDGVPFISGLVPYKPAKFTQSLDRLGSFSYANSRIMSVPRSSLEKKWHSGVPGGMEGVSGYRSDLYKMVPDGLVSGKGWKYLDNGTYNPYYGRNDHQWEQGYVRRYPPKTLFVDLLSHRGKPFEGRAREKDDVGEWHSYVFFRDKTARPPGYNGLRGKTCFECHSEAGSGGYSTGLIPGGDQTLSDPFPNLEN